MIETSSDERQQVIVLTEEQMDAIADRAVDKAWSRLAEQVGKSVMRKAAWVIGAGVLALFIWLAAKGELPK